MRHDRIADFSREDDEQQVIASSFEQAEENWTDLAERFVRLFGGTFQCDIGHTVRSLPIEISYTDDNRCAA